MEHLSLKISCSFLAMSKERRYSKWAVEAVNPCNISGNETFLNFGNGFIGEPN